MKIIISSTLFKRRLKKLSPKILILLKERVAIFRENEFDQILNNHKLNGVYLHRRSINITGDIRVIYRKISDNMYLFLTIGTHSELYS